MSEFDTESVVYHGELDGHMMMRKQTDLDVMVIIDGNPHILDIPLDITAYESAKLAKLLVLITTQSFFDAAGYVKEQGLTRLFKNRDGEANANG